MRPTPATLGELLARPASREAWLEIFAWFYGHRGDPDSSAAAARAAVVLDAWPDRFRRIDSSSYLWELYRGDDPQPYWALGRALAIDLGLLADRRFAPRGLAVVERLPVLIVERELRPRVRHSAAVVQRALARVPSIRELILDDSRSGTATVSAIVGAAPVLQALDLTRCRISAGGLSRVLSQPAASRLRELDASDNGLELADFFDVARSPASRTIEVLSVSRNTMSTVSSVVEPPLVFPALRDLNLSACHLDLIESLPSWRAPILRDLDLSLQSVRAPELESLAAWLPESISRLSLAATGLGSDSGLVLRKLVGATQLETLDLRENELSQDSEFNRAMAEHGLVNTSRGLYTRQAHPSR